MSDRSSDYQRFHDAMRVFAWQREVHWRMQSDRILFQVFKGREPSEEEAASMRESIINYMERAYGERPEALRTA